MRFSGFYKNSCINDKQLYIITYLKRLYELQKVYGVEEEEEDEEEDEERIRRKRRKEEEEKKKTLGEYQRTWKWSWLL